MEKFLDKFSLYEFFAYLIPGATLLGIIKQYHIDISEQKNADLFFQKLRIELKDI